MSLRFSASIALGLSLLLLSGCGEPTSAVASGHAANVASGSFDVGRPAEYRRPGVYRGFADSHGVYLVSGHQMLVALAAECTNPEHRSAEVRWDEVAGVFRCATCDAKYTRDGLNRGTSRARLALQRCRIRQSGQIYDPASTIIVDPGSRFVQERQEWSKSTSYFPLTEVLQAQQTAERAARSGGS